MRRKRPDAAALVKALKSCIGILEQQALGRVEYATDHMLAKGLFQSQDFDLPAGGRLDVHISVRMTPPEPELLMIEGPRR